MAGYGRRPESSLGEEILAAGKKIESLLTRQTSTAHSTWLSSHGSSRIVAATTAGSTHRQAQPIILSYCPIEASRLARPFPSQVLRS